MEKSKLARFLDRYTCVTSVQILKDGGYQTIFNDVENDKVLLYDGHLRNPVSLPLKEHTSLGKISAVNIGSSQYGYLGVEDGKQYRVLEYRKNQFYGLAYLAYLFLYLIFVWFFHLITMAQAKRLKKRFEMQQQFAELQMKNYRNQLDPHFAFNAMNTIGTSILKEDRLQAYQLFIDFSRMLGTVLDSSTKILIPLQEELNFTDQYLTFQQTRFPERFTCTIQMEEGVNRLLQVPKMCIQGAVENAIKHGFYGITKDGVITIDVSKQEKQTVISIENNGISIAEAKAANTGNQGKGHGVLQEQLRFLRKNQNYKATFRLVDLYALGGKGTRVEIQIEEGS